MNDQRREYLAAPCGLFCGACTLYVANQRGESERVAEMARQAAARRGVDVAVEELACDGCLSPGKVAFYCRICALRSCAQGRGLTRCLECDEFPCQPISDFNDDGRPHHSEVLSNVRHQKEIGVETWLDEQERRWRCPACGARTDWYARQCASCGTDLPRQF